MTTNKSTDIRAGGAYVELGAEDSGLEKELENIKKKFEKAGADIALIGATLFSSGAIIFEFLRRAVMEFSEFGDSAAKTGKRVGITAGQVGELQHALSLAGASAGDLDTGFRGMSRAVLELNRGGEKIVETFNMLGLSVDYINSLSPDEKFIVVGKRIAAIADTTQRAAIMMEIFGKSGAMLIPFFEQSTLAIEEARLEARAFGIALSDDAAARAEQLNDELGRTQQAAKGVRLAIGSIMAPVVIDLMKAFERLLIAVRMYIVTNPELITGMAKLARTMLQVGAGILAVKAALLALQNPYIILIALAGAAALLMLDAFGQIDTGMGDLLEGFRYDTYSMAAYWKSMVIQLKIFWLEFVSEVLMSDWVGKFFVGIATAYNEFVHSIGLRSDKEQLEYRIKIDSMVRRGIFKDGKEDLQKQMQDLEREQNDVFAKDREKGKDRLGFKDALSDADALMKRLEEMAAQAGETADIFGTSIPELGDGGVVGAYGGAGIAQQMGFTGVNYEKDQSESLRRIEGYVRQVAENTQGGSAPAFV